MRPVISYDSEDYSLSQALYGLLATSPFKGRQNDALPQHKAVPAITKDKVDFRVPQIIEIADN